MSLFDDVKDMSTPPESTSADAALVADPGAAGHGSGFVTITPNLAPNAYQGGWTAQDHLGHQHHVSAGHAPNAYQNGATVDDGQGHTDHYLPLPGGGLWHP